MLREVSWDISVGLQELVSKDPIFSQLMYDFSKDTIED